MELRKQKEWSIQDVADRLGIPKSTYAGYESGYRRPSLEALASISDLFETSLDYLMGRVEDPAFHSKEEDPIELTKLMNDNLTVDGKPLSIEEIQHLVAFVRAKRELEKYDKISG